MLVLNNYPLEPVWDAVRRGDAPDNLLYGVNRFARAGFEVELVPFARASGLRRLQGAVHGIERLALMGDLAQQWAALRCVRRADLVYAPCQTQTALLAYLRAAGLLRVPIVALAHHALNPGRLARLRAPATALYVRGHDALPSLSRRVAAEIDAIVPGRSAALPWGPPPQFFPEPRGTGEGVLSVGRTARDFVTFARGAALAGYPARILCTPGCVTPEFAAFAANVEVQLEPEQGFMGYGQLVGIYAAARAIAIPLAPARDSLSGLSSLADALGMGKPVIMTRQPFVDLDIEAEGAGYWVDPGDEVAWADRIRRLAEDPDTALRMGRRARELVHAGFNSERFANDMLELFARVLDRR